MKSNLLFVQYPLTVFYPFNPTKSIQPLYVPGKFGSHVFFIAHNPMLPYYHMLQASRRKRQKGAKRPSAHFMG